MSKENWSKIAWIIIILCFGVLIFVGQIKIRNQNNILSDVSPKADIQKNTENYNLNIDEKYKNLKGIVSSVEENYISITDSLGNKHEIYEDELLNCRTREPIKVSQVNAGDYYKNGEIIRNISGNELRNELLLNMSRSFNSSKLSVKFTRLKRLKVYNRYVTFKVSFYDENYELFGKNKPELFNIELIANENTVLYARSKIVSIYNLQKSVRDKVFYLGIDEKTLLDERPVVTDFEIAE